MRRSRKLILRPTFMDQQDPDLLWRAVEVVIQPDGTESVTAFANNG